MENEIDSINDKPVINVVIQFSDSCRYDAVVLSPGRSAIYYDGHVFCDIICFQAFIREKRGMHD